MPTAIRIAECSTDDVAFAIWADAMPGGWNAISTGGAADPPNRLRNAAVPYYITNHRWDSRESTNGIGR
jgi:hypothetical protein